MAAPETTAQSALNSITEQLKEAIAAPKCHKCGCLQQTVEALAETEAGKGELAPVLTEARSVFVPKKAKAHEALTLEALLSDWQVLHLASKRPRYAAGAVRALRNAFPRYLDLPAADLTRSIAVKALDASWVASS